MFREDSGKFEFIRGPLFANLVLADEINRTTPRAQSALLEAMNENQITVDNITHPLETPFVVLATQNPRSLLEPIHYLNLKWTDSYFGLSWATERKWRKKIRRFGNRDVEDLDAFITKKN